MKPKIIALVGGKGGISKSSTSAHLCRWLAKQGHSVALADCDTQQSSSVWMSAIASPPSVYVLASSDEVLDRIPAIRAKHDYTVVDGPAGLSELNRAILLRCDLALVPCKPSAIDLRSTSETLHLIEQAQSVREGKPKAALFLAMAIKGSRLKTESLEVLTDFSKLLLKSVIHQRQCVADCFGQQSTVFDMSGRAAAASAREYSHLFEEALTLL